MNWDCGEIPLGDPSICMLGTTWTAPVADGIEYYDVEVEHLGGVEYRCTAKTSDGDKSMDYPKYEDKPKDKTIGKWIADMTMPQVMAGHKIYYDIWNFEDNSALNKELLEAFENAKIIRRPMTPVVGTLQYRLDTETTWVFTGSEWIQFGAKNP